MIRIRIDIFFYDEICICPNEEYIFPVSAKTKWSFEAYLERLAAFLEKTPSLHPAAIASALQKRTHHPEYRAAFTAASVQELSEKLAAYRMQMNGVLLLQLIKRDILSFFPLPRTPADIRIGEIEIPLIHAVSGQFFRQFLNGSSRKCRPIPRRSSAGLRF